MANYIELNTGRYPVSQTQIRAENPNTSYPASFPTPEGYAVVFPAPTPTCDPITEIAREIQPVLTSKGTYEQAYEIVPRFQEYTDDEGVVHTVQEQEAAAIAKDTADKAEALRVSVTAATQLRLDTCASTRNYDGILSACTYATSGIPKFQAEGQYCVNARDTTWAALYSIMQEVLEGTRPMPSGFADIEGDLPELVWPE
jgi:DNA gyrase inhibitor GyrI